MRSWISVQTLTVDILIDSDPSNWLGNPLNSNFETAIILMDQIIPLMINFTFQFSVLLFLSEFTVLFLEFMVKNNILAVIELIIKNNLIKKY